MSDAREAGLEISAERRPSAWFAWAAIFVAVVASVWPTMAKIAWQLDVDEGRYLAFMQRVCREGLDVFPKLFDEYLAGPAPGMFPDPLRIGHIVTLGAFGELFGASIETVALVSLLAHLALLLVTFRGVRAAFGDGRALAATALVGFSPLLLGLSRRALMDGVAVLWMSLAIWSWIAFVREPHRRRRLLLFALALFWAMLVKETIVLLAVPLALHAAWRKFACKSPLPVVATSLAFVVPGALVFVAWVVAAGGSVEKVFAMARALAASPATNEYAVDFGSGPWVRYLIDFLCLSPWVTLLAIVAFGPCLARMARRELDPTREALVFVVIVYLAMFAFLTKNVRYLAIAEVPLRVLAVLWVFDAFANVGRRVVAGALVLLVIGLCVGDLLTYRAFFIEQGMYDPMTTVLMLSRGVLPMLR